LKFIASLIILIIGLYFGADHLLSTHFKTNTPTAPAEEKALVQNMAKFLEESPDLQKKITESGQVIAKPATATKPAAPVVDADLEKVARYFGSSPTDDYFKKVLIQKKKMNPDDQSEQTKFFVEVSGYVHEHPKETVEALENALQSIPMDMQAERSAVVPAFIHSSIIFLEESGADDQTKKTYLKRFINGTQDPEVKDALETHFPDLLDEAPPSTSN